MQDRFDVLIDSFLENDVGLNRSFLSAELCEGLRQNLTTLENNSELKSAGIGNNLVKDQSQTTRGDQIYWLDKKHENKFEQEFLTTIELFIEQLNRTCYTGINAFEFHYAVYDAGSYYKRHKDQFKNDSDRKFSLIFYLNENRTSEDGGELIVYGKEKDTKILPLNQTAVLFDSSKSEHEVNFVFKKRRSITGWLKQV